MSIKFVVGRICHNQMLCRRQGHLSSEPRPMRNDQEIDGIVVREASFAVVFQSAPENCIMIF